MVLYIESRLSIDTNKYVFHLLRKSIGTPKYALTYDHLLLIKQLHPELAKLCETIKILNATATLGLCRHCLNKSNIVVKLQNLDLIERKMNQNKKRVKFIKNKTG